MEGQFPVLPGKGWAGAVLHHAREDVYKRQVAAIAIRGGFLTVTPEFAWLGGTAALVTLSVACLLYTSRCV